MIVVTYLVKSWYRANVYHRVASPSLSTRVQVCLGTETSSWSFGKWVLSHSFLINYFSRSCRFYDVPNVFSEWKIWTAGREDGSVFESSSHMASSLHDNLYLQMTEWTVFSDSDFKNSSWAHVMISMTERCLSLMQCDLGAQISEASSVKCWPCRMPTEISPESCNVLMILCNCKW